MPVQIIPELTVIVDRDPANPSDYLMDVAVVRARQFQANPCVDLVVSFRDQSGRELRGRLEEAPAGVVAIDADDPPAWLS